MKTQGNSVTDRWIHPLLAPSILEHSSICLVGLLLAAGDLLQPVVLLPIGLLGVARNRPEKV
jgi:hypothetical protein